MQPVGRKGFNIRGQEETEIRVEQIKVTVEDLYREFIIKAGIFVVPVGQEFGRQVTAQALLQAGLEQHLFRWLGGGPYRSAD